jgi:hypothetical protein
MLSWVALNLGSAPEFRCFRQIHDYSAPGHQCRAACLVRSTQFVSATIIGLRHTCHAQLARCRPHSVCLARIAGSSRDRLTFVKSMTTKCPVTMCIDSACLVLCTQFVCLASLVLRQTCHSRLPGVASTQFVMTMHRWLRVSACSSWAYVMRTASAVIVMVRERRRFDAID